MQQARRGLLLDLDGTLAQSVGLLEGIYYRFLEQRGRSGSPAEFTQLNGPPFAEVVAALKRSHHLPEPLDELKADYLNLIREGYAGVHPSPGALDLAAAAARAQWRIGVVTSNVLEITSSWLHQVGLQDYIHAITTAEMVARGKPHPDIYLQAMVNCDCDAAVSLAVEDTLTGARSAAGAGLTTYLIASDENARGDLPAGVLQIQSLMQLIPVVQKGAAQ